LGISRVKERTAIAVGFGAILLWMFLPMIPVFIAGAIASHIVFGRDIGGTLYKMGVMGWFGLLTFPSGFLMLIVLTVKVIKSRRN
jgi:hypothetical protein